MDELTKAVQELKNGNQDAFQTVYNLTNKTALAVIRKYCDNPDDYEDILQDTYIKVYQSIGELRDDTKAQAWINRIAANTAIRSNMKKKPTLFSEMENEEGQIPDIMSENPDYDPAAVSDRASISEAVNEVMAMIPEDQRDAVWLFYGQQVSIKEIAEGLGISENTIKSRIYLGRQKLLAHKADFRKRGIEVTAIPLAVLVGIAFDNSTSYAAETAAAGAAAISSAVANASEVGAGVSEATTVATAASDAASVGATVASGEATVGATVTTGGSVTAGAATTTGGAAATGTAAAGAASASTGAAGAAAAATGLSLAAKIGIAAAVVVIGGGAAVGVTSAVRSSRNAEETVPETAIIEELDEDIPDEIIEETVPVILAEEPTEDDFHTMAEIITELGGVFSYYTDDNDELIVSEMSNQKIVNFLSAAVFENYEALHLTPVDRVEGEQYQGIWHWVEKDSALANCSALFGRTITDKDIEDFNEAAGYDELAIEGNALGTQYLDGSWWTDVYPETYTIDGEYLTAVAYYEYADDSSGVYNYGRGTAVFKANPDSYIGYTLVSMTLDDSPLTRLDSELADSIQAEDSSAWRQAYADFVTGNTDPQMQDGYALLYIDDDDIPELYVKGDIWYGGELITFSDGQAHVNEFNLRYPYYVEKDNLIITSEGRREGGGTYFYTIENGEIEPTIEGTFSINNYDEVLESLMEIDPTYDYFWDGMQVNEEEYRTNINALENAGSRVLIQDLTLYSPEEMLSILNSNEEPEINGATSEDALTETISITSDDNQDNVMTESGDYNEYGLSTVAIDMLTHSMDENNVKYPVQSIDEGDFDTTVTYQNGFQVSYQDRFTSISVEDNDIGKRLFKYYDASIASARTAGELLAENGYHVSYDSDDYIDVNSCVVTEEYNDITINAGFQDLLTWRTGDYPSLYIYYNATGSRD